MGGYSPIVDEDKAGQCNSHLSGEAVQCELLTFFGVSHERWR